ncbi:Inositol phosphorylceramide synthase [Spathaspora sp. JA1]|nr:Inositol phosphorylceramide synthase [Spathaspora sp. JA1]
MFPLRPFNLFQTYFLSEKVPSSTLSDLNTDSSISTSIRKLKRYRWSRGEILHYGLLTSVFLFVFIILPVSFLIKLPIILAFITCLLVPITSQFFLPALPVFAWLALYFTCSKIPNTWKPAISVQVLPAMETILYGDDLSNVLAAINTRLFDIIAWLPYGILHFSLPFVVAGLIFLFGPPTALRSFGFAFGYMNLFGVIIQIVFPAAAPWYKNIYGLEPANYSMHGSPGGLGRIDELLGFDMYTTGFSNSPVIFGAFPSLHSGCSVMDVLFLSWLFPRFRPLWIGYACWLWWSTMYLTHHYFVDLVGGAMLSFVVFEFTKYKYLPKCDSTKFCRWSYTEVKNINIGEIDPLSQQYIYTIDDESRLYTRIYPEQQHAQPLQQIIPIVPQVPIVVSEIQQEQEQSFEMSDLRVQEEDEVSSNSSNSPSVFENEPIYISSNTSLDEMESSTSGGSNLHIGKNSIKTRL